MELELPGFKIEYINPFYLWEIMNAEISVCHTSIQLLFQTYALLFILFLYNER